jgi:hypothetical protein
VDFSASTMVIPIVDLTETAEGSALREDLQTSLSFKSAEAFNVTAAQVNQIITPGYFRVTGNSNVYTNASGSFTSIFINDGTTDKNIFVHSLPATSTFAIASLSFDFIAFLEAGDTLTVKSFSANSRIDGVTRQVADLQGNLTNP